MLDEVEGAFDTVLANGGLSMVEPNRSNLNAMRTILAFVDWKPCLQMQRIMIMMDALREDSPETKRRKVTPQDPTT
jgi:hypothetical protein